MSFRTGLPQTGIIANKQLQFHLQTHGYYQVKHTHGLFRHHTRTITFTLVVDDFGIKYTCEADLEHLLAAIKSKYTTTVDLSGTLYCGLTLAWNYRQRHVDISMPGYIDRALTKFKHITASRPQHAPHPFC